MQTGHIDLRQADEEVSLANEQRLKDGMSRPRQLWALAAQKMGINTEEAQKAGRGMANVAVKAATLDLKAIRRKGSGASWASIIEEKRRQDKIAEAELEENAKVCGVVVAVFVCACVCACVCVCVSSRLMPCLSTASLRLFCKYADARHGVAVVVIQNELKNWAADLGLVVKPHGDFDRQVAAGRRLVAEDIVTVDELKKQRQYEAEDAAMGQNALRKKAMRAQSKKAAQADVPDSAEDAAAGRGRRPSVSSSAVSVTLLNTPNVMMQTSTGLALSVAGGGGDMGGGDTGGGGGGFTMQSDGTAGMLHGTAGMAKTSQSMFGMATQPPRDVSVPQYPIIRSRTVCVAPLCNDWVLGTCMGDSLNCPSKGRHYFVSHNERSDALHARMAQEASLERSIVAMITQREGLVEALRESVDFKRRLFLESASTQRPTQADLAEELAIMNQRTYRGGRPPPLSLSQRAVQVSRCRMLHCPTV